LYRLGSKTEVNKMKRKSEHIVELETYTLLNPDFGVDTYAVFGPEQDQEQQIENDSTQL
jgi:hypothetical protein